MIHELRIYHCQPGKLNAELDRLKAAATTYFPRHGINVLGYWSVLVGPSNHDIYYIIEWGSYDEREARWTAFLNDPEWRLVREQSEADGVLLASISNILLKPLHFD